MTMAMPKLRITVVAGLPGAGKTTWATTQAQMHPRAVVVDDFTVNPEAWDQVDWSWHQHVYLADPHLMVATQEQVEALLDRQAGLSSADYRLEWVCFPNDPARCLTRASPGAEGMIEALSRTHVAPDFARHLPWQEGASPTPRRRARP